ncbi:hypothetical protein V8E54_001225 [Elaphomyces granulatus]
MAFHPPISPPPVYLRSSPPPPPPPDLPPPPPPHGRKISISRKPVGSPVARKPLSFQISHDAVIQDSPLSTVKIDDLSGLPQAYHTLIEGPYDDRDRSASPPTQISQPREHNMVADVPLVGSQATQAPTQQEYMLPQMQLPHLVGYKHTSASTDSWSLVEDSNEREDNQNRQNQDGTTVDQTSVHNPSYRLSNSSGGSLDSVAEYQPLQYHHQPVLDALRKDVPSGEHLGSNNHLAPNRPTTSMPRPSSAYSSTSDIAGRGRTHSPHYSPGGRARTSSAHSAVSPDIRPVSFIDLLNVPYPQPPPAPTNLSNAHLRNAIGNNISLLSHRKTFDMYLANVKKTSDSAVQYEFAVFMINAIQDMNHEEFEDGESSTSNGKSPDITRTQLLREARSILQRLADRGYPYAQYYLADGFASGLFNKGNEDYDHAFPLFVAASKHGHAEAGYRAALCYEFGWGSRVDAAKAIQFYRQAASKSHPGAMLRLARACLAGDMGLGKRYREGIKWLQRAVEAADVQYNSAPYELGVLHETGFGDDVFIDQSYAAQLFTKSAELGHADASYRLGDAYEHGKLNCPRDPALSIHFYTGAAQAGHSLAMMALCAWYMVGAEPVLEKDENEAYEWAKQAAECGLAKAQYAVGYFTEMGIGCRRDPLEANVWYVKSADQGDERAIHRLAAISAAAEGTDPNQAAAGTGRRGKRKPKVKGSLDADTKSKYFGIF